MRQRNDATAAGFTIIELLIAIAIIALLVAIMLPALAKAKRLAMVLACPILYCDADHQPWLSSLDGGLQLEASDVQMAGMLHWAPDGSRFAGFQVSPEADVAVVEPVTGHADIYGTPTAFNNPEWLDQGTLMSSAGWPSPHSINTLDLGSGQIDIFRSAQQTGVGGTSHIYKDPHLIGGYVTCEAEGFSAPLMDVYLRDENYHRSKVIWEDPANNYQDMFAKPDWLGERIGWSRAVNPNSGSTPLQIAFKHVNDRSSKEPTCLSVPGAINSVFCDWTPDGDILAAWCAPSGEWSLAVLDTAGNLLRDIPTPEGTNALHAPASIRRARHY